MVPTTVPAESRTEISPVSVSLRSDSPVARMVKASGSFSAACEFITMASRRPSGTSQ